MGQEFARVLFGAPTIYLTLPFSCAHWAIVRAGHNHTIPATLA